MFQAGQYLFNLLKHGYWFGQIAQLVEQRTENPRVGGSIPSLATMYSTDNHCINLCK